LGFVSLCFFLFPPAFLTTAFSTADIVLFDTRFPLVQAT
jgi:hypothetical protein